MDVQPGQRYPKNAQSGGNAFNQGKSKGSGAYQALYITQGAGIIETAHTPAVTRTAPFLLLLFPDVWHRYRPDPSTGWSEMWIRFKGEIPKQLVSSNLIDPAAPIIDVGRNETILSQFQRALDELRNEAPGCQRVAASAVVQILALATCLPQRRVEENHPMKAIVRRACFLMKERSDRVLQIEKLSNELNVGYTYFRRMFKHYTGFSPKQYHSQLRLERAKHLLENTQHSIGKIADSLEFDSSFHFSKWFKKNSGSAPSNWRTERGL